MHPAENVLGSHQTVKDTYVRNAPPSNAGKWRIVGDDFKLLGDASNRFIAETIDFTVYRALASRAGGEVVSGF